MSSPPQPSLRQALTQIRDLGVERLDAQMLLLLALHRDPHDRAWLISHDLDPLPPEAANRLNALAQRRLSAEPMAYLQGEKDFFGLRLQVDPRVLIPRPDTETLVSWALEVLRPIKTEARLVDLGTGSGAIALAIKHQRPDLDVTATDASPDALAVAQANAARLNLSVRFVQGSWLAAVPGMRFDVVVSNPPYIADDDGHLPALVHEPKSALTSGADGLNDLRSLVDTAPDALLPDGWLLLEHGHDQAEHVRTLMLARGFVRVSSRNDLAGIARCTGGIWPEQR
ncbi:MAG: peptide chain release factor N(5)-glutamine methyltransferase [Burkholderiaceae bacterium]